MIVKRVARSPVTFGVLSALALLISALTFGIRGVAGMTVGLGATTIGSYFLWQVIRLAGKAVTEGATAQSTTILVVLGFFLKIPLLLAAFWAANRIGGAAPACFIAGVVLVYFALVTWAAARS